MEMSWLQSINDFKYLLFLLVPVGIYQMVVSIKKLTAFAKAKMIYEMSVSAIEGSFRLEDGGKYDIWLSGKKYAVSPIYNLDIKLKNNATGKSVILYPDFFRTTTSSIKDFRVKLSTFDAETGSYNISLTDSVEERENIINNRGIDYKKFSIQIRENVQGLTIFLGVLGIILGFMAIDVGLVFPLLYKF